MSAVAVPLSIGLGIGVILPVRDITFVLLLDSGERTGRPHTYVSKSHTALGLTRTCGTTYICICITGHSAFCVIAIASLMHMHVITLQYSPTQQHQAPELRALYLILLASELGSHTSLRFHNMGSSARMQCMRRTCKHGELSIYVA